MKTMATTEESLLYASYLISLQICKTKSRSPLGRVSKAVNPISRKTRFGSPSSPET